MNETMLKQIQEKIKNPKATSKQLLDITTGILDLHHDEAGQYENEDMIKKVEAILVKPLVELASETVTFKLSDAYPQLEYSLTVQYDFEDEELLSFITSNNLILSMYIQKEKMSVQELVDELEKRRTNYSGVIDSLEFCNDILKSCQSALIEYFQK